MKRLIKIILIFGIIFPLATVHSSSIAAPSLSQAPVKITIFHTNDLHAGRYEAGVRIYSRILAYMTKKRQELGEENVLLLDGGDMCSTNRCDNEDAFLVDEIFKKIGYVAVAIGNHEMDCGAAHFVARQKNAGGLSFLGANLTRKNRDGNCTWQPYFEAYRIFEMGPDDNRVKVAVIGLAREVGRFKMNDDIICVQKPVDALVHFYDVAQSEGAQIIIILAHRGAR